MKIYNLNIDTSKPVKKVMQMQQNETGLLKLNVTNDGKSIRNLTTKVYDGETEVPSTDNGFKIDMSKNEKVVKIEAKSTPIICTKEVVKQMGTGRNGSKFFSIIQLPAGYYRQEEFYDGLVRLYYSSSYTEGYPIAMNVHGNDTGKVNFAHVWIMPYNKEQPVQFVDGANNLLPVDRTIVVTDTAIIGYVGQIKTTGTTFDYIPYVLMGEYTDYQLDTTIRPSVNAPYDGEYTEPLTEIEVDGVKFVPTTLTIDGVEYRVLAHTIESETPTEPTNDGQ